MKIACAIPAYATKLQPLTIDAPFSVAMLSSIDRGMIELDMMKHPIDIIIRKNGCDAFTTRSLRLQYVHNAHPTDRDIAITEAAKPTGRILVKKL